MYPPETNAKAHRKIGEKHVINDLDFHEKRGLMLRFYVMEDLNSSKFQSPSQPLCKFMAPSYKINRFLLKIEPFLTEKLHPQRKVVSNV